MDKDANVVMVANPARAGLREFLLANIIKLLVLLYNET